MTPITRDKAAQPLTLPFNPPCNALAADPSAQGTHHNGAVIPWYSDPNISALHFKEIDGDSSTSDAKELLESRREVGPSSEDVDSGICGCRSDFRRRCHHEVEIRPGKAADRNGLGCCAL